MAPDQRDFTNPSATIRSCVTSRRLVAMSAITGAEISRGFYREVVGPLVRAEFPGLRHAAGRWGSGSDVLGLDDEASRDHDWGCRLVLLVDCPDAAALPELDRVLADRLPERFAGFPVRFPVTGCW